MNENVNSKKVFQMPFLHFQCMWYWQLELLLYYSTAIIRNRSMNSKLWWTLMNINRMYLFESSKNQNDDYEIKRIWLELCAVLRFICLLFFEPHLNIFSTKKCFWCWKFYSYFAIFFFGWKSAFNIWEIFTFVYLLSTSDAHP